MTATDLIDYLFLMDSIKNPVKQCNKNIVMKGFDFERNHRYFCKKGNPVMELCTLCTKNCYLTKDTNDSEITAYLHKYSEISRSFKDRGSSEDKRTALKI